jgi:ribosome-associated heat shock protein Hsp15
MPAPAPPPDTASIRLDKWLWAARLFKTRSLAADEIERGRVRVNGAHAKPSREVRLGDAISVLQGSVPVPRVVIVQGLSLKRGPAPEAQSLFAETAESVAARAQFQANRRSLADPALAIEQGRPTKRDRRQLVEWQRWSATADDTD